MTAGLLLLLSLAAAPQPERSSPGYPAYQRAHTHFVEKRFPEAEAAIEEALRLDPRLAPALTLKAKLALAVNRFDVARECLERALAADPHSAYAQFLYGFQFYLQNEMTPAAAALQKARQLDPKDPRAALYLGLVLESLGETEKAARLYEEAIRLEDASRRPQAETLLTYARLLFVSARLEECGRAIDRALALEPASRDAHFERARLLLRQGEATAAAAAGEKALRLPGPGVADQQIRYLLLRAYRASGQEARAAEHAAAIRTADSIRPSPR